MKPTSGVISSGSSISVTITFQGLSSEARVPNFLKSKQKFMVQYRLLEGNADTSQPAAALVCPFVYILSNTFLTNHCVYLLFADVQA